jgi:hypothetical protein
MTYSVTDSIRSTISPSGSGHGFETPAMAWVAFKGIEHLFLAWWQPASRDNKIAHDLPSGEDMTLNTDQCQGKILAL